MFKGKLAFLTLIAALLLCWGVLPTTVDNAQSGIDCPCSSSVSGPGGCFVVCPEGDGPTLEEIGAVITLIVKSCTSGIPGVPAWDIWLYGCNNTMCLCGGSASIDADSATSAFPPVGRTTISGAMAAGGCDTDLWVIAQGVVLGCPPTNCLPYVIVSPDINCDLTVDVVDLALFAGVYVDQPGGYDACYDHNCDGRVDIIDFAIFAQHYMHSC